MIPTGKSETSIAVLDTITALQEDLQYKGDTVLKTLVNLIVGKLFITAVEECCKVQ